MEAKKRIQGDLSLTEVQEWRTQMKREGCTKFWPWICACVRQHIQGMKDREERTKTEE